MFTFRPELAGEDDEDADDMVYGADSEVLSPRDFGVLSKSDRSFEFQDEDVDDVVAKAIDESLFLEEEADGSGTNAQLTQRDWGSSSRPAAFPSSGDAQPSSSRANDDDAVYVDDVPVDADLFDEEDDDEDEEDSDDDRGNGDDQSDEEEATDELK
jgi:hypothetical protein